MELISILLNALRMNSKLFSLLLFVLFFFAVVKLLKLKILIYIKKKEHFEIIYVEKI